MPATSIRNRGGIRGKVSPPGPSKKGNSSAAPFLVTALLAMLLVPAAAPSYAVDLDIGNGTGTVGETITVPITTGDLTGLNVYSYELTITWSTSNCASLVDAPVSGTVSAPWGNVTVNSRPGGVDIAAAGVVPLTGAGTLLNLRFLLGPNAYTTSLTFADFMFNEGDPPAVLTGGTLYISAPPSINIYPDTGEIVVGDSLEFGTSGGTAPYTYGSTDPAIGDFAGTDHLKGISPGAVHAFVEDDDGITDTTTGQIYVRALKLTAGDESGWPGETVMVPVSITDPGGYEIKSAEFSVGFDDVRLTAVGTADGGTVAEAAGWSASEFSVTEDRIDIAMAGSQNLSSAGVLVYIEFMVNPATYSSNVYLTPSGGVFNECYPPLHENGSLHVNAFPVLTVYPDGYAMVAGDELDFWVSGAAVPPLDWGVTNPAVAAIDGTGHFTALAGGETRVYVIDDIGAADTTAVISICDLYLEVADITAHTYFPTAVPVSPDRDVGGLDIYGYEMTLTFNETYVTFQGATSAGTMAEAWGDPVVNNSTPGEVTIVNAGAVPLSGDLPLVLVYLEGLPGSEGQYSNLDIGSILFNEGDPCALTSGGRIDIVTGEGEDIVPAMRLGQNFPNPFNPSTVIRYSVEKSGPAGLNIYSPGGILVRKLVDSLLDAGISYEVRWDGTNDRGERVASGVYFYRLEEGGRTVVKKMILLR